jgi:hypothetical protein
MTGKELMGLRMRVRSALMRHYRARPGMYGIDWAAGRLFNENIYRGRRLSEMNESDCVAALNDLAPAAKRPSLGR